MKPWHCCLSWWGTGNAIPQDLLGKLIKSWLANPGAARLRKWKGAPGPPGWKAQPGHSSSPLSPSSHPPCLFHLCPIILAKLDQALHMQTPSYPAQENARLCEEILGVPATPGIQMHAGPTLAVGWWLLPRSRGSSGGV